MLLAVSLALLLPVGSVDEPFLEIPYPEALTRAAETDRVVLIDFFTTWCGPCKKLDAVTWKDEAVRDWLAMHCVALKIDAEREAELAKHFSIDTYPSIVLVRPNGSELGRIVGFRSPSAFLAEVPDVLAGVRRSDRVRQELEGEGWEDVELRQELADALVEEHRDAEALEHYLWCYDEGLEHDPAFAGVRNSFLLNDIANLGRRYPPALDALRERRDAAEKLLLAGSAPLDRASDFSALNRSLGDDDRTLKVFDLLKGKEETRAGSMRYDPRYALFESVQELLIERRRYADFLEFMGPVGEGFRRCTRTAKTIEAFGGLSEEQLAMTRDRAAANCGLFYEALLGTGDRDADAAALLEKTLEFRDTPEVRRMLADHARRAGREDLVGELLAWDSTTPQAPSAASPLSPQPTSKAPGPDPSASKDPMARQREAQQLVAQGELERASELFFWCYDEGARVDPAYVGVRNSFLLFDIVQLGASYPPALEELRGRRDRLAENALAGRGTLGDVLDLAAINRALAQPEHSLEVFDGLPKGPPDRKHDGYSDGRDVLFDEVKSLLIERRRYADYLEFLGTVDEGFARFTRYYDLAKSTSDGSESDAQSIAYARAAAVGDSAELLEALLASKAPAKDIDHLVDLVLALDDSPETRAVLAQHARRAADEELAKKLLEKK